MESLEVLEISNCPKLDRFPEISEDMHRLSELTLQSTGIRELPLSIGNLSGLTSPDLEHCEDLVSLPNSLSNLKNLRFLCFRGCKRLEKIPENIGDLQVLEELDTRETAISQLPLSITKLGKLKKLRFSNEHFAKNLDISGTNISCLPKSICKLSRFFQLNIQFCQNLNELSGELPPNLERLYADYYLASKSIEDLLINCGTLKLISQSLHGHEDTECEPVVLMFIQQFLRTCIKDVFHRRNFFRILFDQVRIPKYFGYQFTNQRKVSIDLNPSWYNDRFMGFSIFFYSNRGRCSKVTLIANLTLKENIPWTAIQIILEVLILYVSYTYHLKHGGTILTVKDGRNQMIIADLRCLHGQGQKHAGLFGWNMTRYENKVKRCTRKLQATQSP
ncbi:hypothetical protein BC332_33041 [Capsicum chinense]|nr:hypothetical protein BC332_33041 [Capsicum chinense]